jgi:hypothetical protein
MHPEAPFCCDQKMKKGLGGGSEILFQGEIGSWPSKQFKRDREDNYIRSVTKRARDLKGSGSVRPNDHLSFKDVDKLNPN